MAGSVPVMARSGDGAVVVAVTRRNGDRSAMVDVFGVVGAIISLWKSRLCLGPTGIVLIHSYHPC